MLLAAPSDMQSLHSGSTLVSSQALLGVNAANRDTLSMYEETHGSSSRCKVLVILTARDRLGFACLDRKESIKLVYTTH